MIVYLSPVAGSPESNLNRAHHEIDRILGFRGKVTGAKVEGNRIAVTVEISPKWKLSEAEKVSQLSEWIKAKVRTTFKVESIK